MTIIAFNRYWVIRWPWVLINFLAVSLLLGLSFWQWQRATEKIQTLFFDVVNGRAPKYKHWLTPVNEGSANERDPRRSNRPVTVQ